MFPRLAKKYGVLFYPFFLEGVALEPSLVQADGLAANEGFGIYLDENHNGQFEPLSTDSLLREGNYWGLYGAPFRFREIFTGGGVGGIDTVAGGQLGISNTTGHFTGELSIPISFFNETHLRVFGPDKIIGAAIYLRGISGTGASLYHTLPMTRTYIGRRISFLALSSYIFFLSASVMAIWSMAFMVCR